MSAELPASRDVLSRALAVLEELIGNEGREAMGTRELAARLRLSPATAHRILVMLENRGLAERRPGGFGLGVAWWRLASESMSRAPYTAAVAEVLREVASQTGEGVVFSLYDSTRRQLFYAAAIESPHAIRHVIRRNEWLSIYLGASGLAILAFLPAEEQQSILDQAELRPVTSTTITDRDALERELERIRAAGYAQSDGQRVAGARSVAAPVWGQGTLPRGSLMISAPVSRADDATRSAWIPLVIEAAGSLTTRLGGRLPPEYPYPMPRQHPQQRPGDQRDEPSPET